MAREKVKPTKYESMQRYNKQIACNRIAYMIDKKMKTMRDSGLCETPEFDKLFDLKCKFFTKHEIDADEDHNAIGRCAWSILSVDRIVDRWLRFLN